MKQAQISVRIIGLAFASVLLVLAHAASAQPPPTPVVVTPVVEQSVAAGQISVGTVMPTKHAVIGSAVDGRVAEFLVNEGDRVEKGQPLARLLTDTSQLELEGAKAVLRLRQAELDELNNGSRPEEIAKANAQLLRTIARREYANNERDRAIRLFKGKITSEAEHGEAIAEAAEAEQTVREAKATYELAMQGPRKEKIAQARARVDVQQALVERLQDQITKHTIISRFDGFVTAEHTEEGAWVKSGDPVAEVAALDQVEIQTYVTEKHVPFVEIGSTVRVEIPALENRIFMGRVARVVPQADVRARTFPVKVHVENVVEDSNPLLKAGMYARVTLPTGPRQQMKLVPKDALVLGGEQPTVFVVDVTDKEERQGTVRPVHVEVGVATGHLIQVTGELIEGQLVVVEGNERLRPAQAVKMSPSAGPRSGFGVGQVGLNTIGNLAKTMGRHETRPEVLANAESAARRHATRLFMKLIDEFVRSPVKVAVGVLLVTLFGLVALIRMPMQLTPEVQTPTITIQTRWLGASPQEVEREITVEQEEHLKGVEGIVKMTSESADSQATITLEFLVGTNMSEALLKVNSRLQQVREYPEEADQPVITTSNASDRAIAWFILSARRPTTENLNEFAQRHPQFADQLGTVRTAHNAGVAMLRLRLLAKDHPEFKELLPPADLEVTKLRRFAEDEIEARFERVAGVAQSNVIGGLEDELQVVIHPEQLAARQLTLTQVRDVLRSQNKDTSAGDFWEGKRRWVVRALGQFRSTEQVENQLLAVRDGAPVFVRDVAEVRLGHKKPDGLVRRFGESSIAINCLRETGANVLDVMDGLRQATAELDGGLLKRRGLQLTQAYDETDYIYSSVKLVRQNIFIGGALAMIVLMLFLHLSLRTVLVIPLIVFTALAAAYVSPWFFAACLVILIGGGFWFARGALVVGLAIPISIVGTFLVLGILGRSLNVVSLAGLAFAVGMLVDNSVVVLENIYRRHAQGESPLTAAVRGAQEVGGAVLASTLTTIAVFLPVAFVQEEAGQLFRDIALAISAAVALSLLVSMTVIPTAAARLFARRESEDEGPRRTDSVLKQRRYAKNGRKVNQPSGARRSSITVGLSRAAKIGMRPVDIIGRYFVDFVTRTNNWIQCSACRRLAVVAILVGAAIGFSWLLWPKVEYLPAGNRNLVFGILLPPPGYNLDKLMELGETVEANLRPHWDVDPESPEAQEMEFPVIRDFFFVARGRRVFLGLRSFDASRAGELVPLIRKVRANLPGTFTVAKQSSLFEQGLSAGRTVEIEITGPDLNRLVAMGGQILRQVNQAMPDAQARPVPSLDMSSPEVHLQPKLLQAAEMGVRSADLGYAINALVDGAYAGDYFLDGKKVDLTLIGDESFASITQHLTALPVATPGGQLVPLGAIAEVRLSSGPEQVNHRERVRVITIEVSPPPEVALEDAMIQITDQIVTPLRESGQLSGGYQINLAGTADKLRHTWQSLKLNILMALLITYLLMAALFESWLYPLVIIFSVPLGAVGGILALNVLNMFVLQSLDVLTMLGFVILIGTVVNNPILIVHQSLNYIRENNMTPSQAILESVRTRIRPIFMTTLTTVLGLMPLVLFPGAGSELYRGLGSVVLGGLVVSTVFTLFLVPSLFSLTMDVKRLLARWFIGELITDAKSVPREYHPDSAIQR